MFTWLTATDIVNKKIHIRVSRILNIALYERQTSFYPVMRHLWNDFVDVMKTVLFLSGLNDLIRHTDNDVTGRGLSKTVS